MNSIINTPIGKVQSQYTDIQEKYKTYAYEKNKNIVYELEHSGFCILRNVLSVQDIVHMRESLQSKKARNVRIRKCKRTHMLFELDLVFSKLLDTLPKNELEKILGKGFHVGAITANTLIPEKKKMSKTDYRKNLANELHIDYPHGHMSKMFGGDHLTFSDKNPWSIAALWMLTDFTTENGATKILPQSHHKRQIPERNAPFASDFHIFEQNCIDATGNAGDLLLFVGEAWHTIGFNHSSADRIGVIASILPFYVKPMENHSWVLKPSIRKKLTSEQLAMIGIPWHHPFGHSTRLGPPRTPWEGIEFAYDSICYEHPTLSHPDLLRNGMSKIFLEFKNNTDLFQNENIPYSEEIINFGEKTANNLWWFPFRIYRIITVSIIVIYILYVTRYRTPLYQVSKILSCVVFGFVLGTLVTLERLRM